MIAIHVFYYLFHFYTFIGSSLSSYQLPLLYAEGVGPDKSVHPQSDPRATLSAYIIFYRYRTVYLSAQTVNQQNDPALHCPHIANDKSCLRQAKGLYQYINSSFFLTCLNSFVNMNT